MEKENPDFRKRKDNNDIFYSPSVLMDITIEVYANGYEDGEGTHVYISIIMFT